MVCVGGSADIVLTSPPGVPRSVPMGENHHHHYPDDYPEPAVTARAREIFARTNTDPHLEYDTVAHEAPPPGQPRFVGIGLHARRHYVALARVELALEL